MMQVVDVDEDVLGFLCDEFTAGVGESARLDELATALDCAGGRAVEDDATGIPAEMEGREV